MAKKPVSSIRASINEELKRYSPSARKIIISAQKLFAENGIDGVSLREIAVSAGHSNNSAVQYHFASKEGLIQAIFELRVPFLEAARNRRLVHLNTLKKITLEDLLEAHLFPILEMFDGQEQRIYTLFSTHLLSRNTLEHPFYRAQEKMPVSIQIYSMLRETLSHLPEDVFNFRIRLIAGLFLSTILERQNVTKSDHGIYSEDDIFWGDMINVLAALLREPFRPQRRPVLLAKAG